MQKLIIEGPNKLKGEVEVSGSKNAALELIPASLLANSPSTIRNVPNILDIRNLLAIIEDLGGKVSFKENVVNIDPTLINSYKPSRKLMGRLRASIMLTIPLLMKFGKVEIPFPGGCNLGKRSLDEHFNAFRSLGIKVKEVNSHYKISTEGIMGTTLNLNFSVTGTANALIAAVLAEGTTIIKLASAEPETLNLIEFLNKMGAKIKWLEGHILEIKGVKKLHGTEIKTIPDRIEAGTFALAAIATHGDVIVKNFVPHHNDAFLFKLREINAKFELGKNFIHIKKGTALKPTKIRTNCYPGFPTDLQAPFAVVLTQAEGISEIFETIYDGRLNYLYELEKMGAKIAIENSNLATIYGPTPLFGTDIDTLDLRAGATLIIASILGQGESQINGAEIIDRGYENIEEKFRKLGARITRVESEGAKNLF